MRVFKDNAGRSWSVCINVDAIKRVRKLLDVNLLEIAGGQLIEQLANDPVLLCNVLYVVIKPEADAKAISDEDFGRAMAGDAIEYATTAFLEELVDFFPSGRRRVLAKALGKLQTLQSRLLTLAEEQLDSPEIDAQIETALKNSGNLSGNSPATLESTPAR